METQKVMSIGAHADDIEAHSGGTLLKCRDNKYEIVYVMTTNNMSGSLAELHPDGKVTHRGAPPEEVMKVRKQECADAAAMLNATVIHLDHPQRHYRDADNVKQTIEYGSKPLPKGINPEGLPSILTACEDKACIKRLADLILEHNPSCIFAHGVATHNIEHLASCLLSTNAYWEAVKAGFKGALLHFREDLTSLGPINAKFDTFIDISDYLDERMELLGKHVCQMPTAHHPDHGHRLRVLKKGVCCGCRAAETFTWVNHHQMPDMDCTFPFYSPLLAELEQNSK